MTDRNFFDLLLARQNTGFHLCVELDTSPDALPPSVKSMNTTRDAWCCFNREVIDATAPFAAAFKLNIAFYEAHWEIGMKVLLFTVDYIHQSYPHIPVIIDAKCADIEAANLNYVLALLKPESGYDFDAVTIHAWHGMDAMRPFLKHRDKGVIVVVRTSNVGANELQNLDVAINEGLVSPEAWLLRRQSKSGPPTLKMYQYLADRVAHQWNVVSKNCAVAADATYPSDVATIRAIIGENMQILSPGFGKWRLGVRAEIRALRNNRGTAFIGNSSSGITGASNGPDFAATAGARAQKLHNLLTQYRLEA